MICIISCTLRASEPLKLHRPRFEKDLQQKTFFYIWTCLLNKSERSYKLRASLSLKGTRFNSNYTKKEDDLYSFRLWVKNIINKKKDIKWVFGAWVDSQTLHSCVNKLKVALGRLIQSVSLRRWDCNLEYKFKKKKKDGGEGVHVAGGSYEEEYEDTGTDKIFNKDQFWGAFWCFIPTIDEEEIWSQPYGV